jgi:hypothetical protein
MAASIDFLRMAPETDDVVADLMESKLLAYAPATAAYSSHERKTAQNREDQRRRGRFGREPGSQGHGS